MVFFTFAFGPIVLATNGLIFEKGDPGEGTHRSKRHLSSTTLKQDGISDERKQTA